MKRSTSTCLLVLLLAATLVACGGDQPAKPGDPGAGDSGEGATVPPTGVSDADISLLKGSVFDDPTPPAVTVLDTLPGNNDLIPPLFQGGPPRVPHGVVDLLPITRDENACLECHLSSDPEDLEDVPQVPDDHKTDLRNAPDTVTAELAGARWACLLCHVSLTDAKPLPESAPGE